ncbi:hypothetical protein [Paucisalibacillus globulus]|uniref:hypothetical protein n=1 Tax=Paucisalibacillus globulus TaxID=351095 RepID=UPI000BB8BC3B|nr:hypothetical protein [Paucisalibacillus globulus]
MESKTKFEFARKIEKKIKFYIVVFVCFTYLYLFTELFLHEFNDIKVFFFPIHIPIYALLSFFLVKQCLPNERDIFHFLFHDEPDNEEWIFRFVRTLGMIALYFIFQLCFMMYFFPSFIELTILDVPLYIPFNLTNAIFITSIYRIIYEEEYSLKFKRKKSG